MNHNPNRCKNCKLSDEECSFGCIKSQHKLNDCARSSDVLLEAINKAERLQKQLDIAVKRLEFLKKKTSAPYDLPAFKLIYQMIEKTLKEIKELESE